MLLFSSTHIVSERFQQGTVFSLNFCLSASRQIERDFSFKLLWFSFLSIETCTLQAKIQTITSESLHPYSACRLNKANRKEFARLNDCNLFPYQMKCGLANNTTSAEYCNYGKHYREERLVVLTLNSAAISKKLKLIAYFVFSVITPFRLIFVCVSFCTWLFWLFIYI